jgi:hypothetical protein
VPVTLTKPESIAEPFPIAFADPESEPFAIGESVTLGKPDAEAESIGTPLPDGESAIFWGIGEGSDDDSVSGWLAGVRVPPVRERRELRPASERGFRSVRSWTLHVTRCGRERRAIARDAS